MKLTRRESLAAIGASAALTALGPLARVADAEDRAAIHVATNTYPWLTFAGRAKRPFQLHSETLLTDIAQTGITGYEPIISSPAECGDLVERLQKHRLEMRSLYVNSTLHDAATARQSVDSVLAIAAAARKLGTRIIVTNPSPIQWGGPEDKNDAQLRLQAEALDQLGAELRKLGMMLAYHNHDAEFRQGGREFHHMLTATDPANVKFCLDAHWVYRGCGDSEVAVFDALTHYHERVVELHLRQSVGGVWTEAFAMKGDIDYARLFNFLSQKSIAPHLVLEQAVEADSPNELSAIEAHRRGRDNLLRGLS